MSVYFDYPSIRDFFDVPGNTAGEKLNDYEDLKVESERLINEQISDINKEFSATSFFGKIML